MLWILVVVAFTLCCLYLGTIIAVLLLFLSAQLGKNWPLGFLNYNPLGQANKSASITIAEDSIVMWTWTA